MTEMFGEAWPPMSVPDLAPDDDDDDSSKIAGSVQYCRNYQIPPFEKIVL